MARACVLLVLFGLVVAGCATGLDGRVSDSSVVRWVEKTVAERQPAAADKHFDQIAWVTDIRTAIQLGKEHNRPIFLYTGTAGSTQVDGEAAALR